MKKLRIGVLGCSEFATRAFIPAILSNPFFQLIAIASRSISKSKKWAEHFSCEAIEGYALLLERDDIDVVYIPLPISMHEIWAIRALESGKHVLCEKSLSVDYASVEKMVAAARKHKRLLMENFAFEHHSQLAFIKQQIAEGTIGELRCLKATFGIPALPINNIRYNPELGGGALLDIGAYPLKICQTLFGPNWKVKAADLHINNARGVDIYGSAYLINDSGLVAQLSWGMDNQYQCALECWGSKGRLSAERIFTAHTNIQPLIIIEQKGLRNTHELPSDHQIKNLLQHFHLTVMTKAFHKSYTTELMQARIIQEVKEAADLRTY